MPIKKGGIKAISTKSSGGGNIISSLGNAINKSNANIKKEFEKPSVKEGLQKAVKIASGVLSVTPIGKAVVMATVAIADKATNSHSASSYLGTDKNNSTLSMVPGGLLFQQVLEVADPKLAHQVESTIPDPKRMAVHDTKTIAKAAATNPSTVHAVAKGVAHDNVKKINSNPVVSHVAPTVVKPTTTLHNPTAKHETVRPSLIHSTHQPIKSTNTRSTLSGVSMPSISQHTSKPSIGDVVKENNSTINVLKTENENVEKPSLISPVIMNEVSPPTPQEAPSTLQPINTPTIPTIKGVSTLQALSGNTPIVTRRTPSIFDFCIIA